MASIKRGIDAKQVVGSHHEGWDQALDRALAGASRMRRGTYDVKVEFSATIRVRNPGQIQRYNVTLTEIPGS
jgi:flavin-binding protein dodecin